MMLEPGDDLHWDAFRYLSGELTAAEAAAFEDRLARDQSAREALAGAVELAGAVVLASDPPTLSIRRRLPVRGIVGLIATAAAVTCMVLVQGRSILTDQPNDSGRERSNPEVVAADPEPGPSLALTWSGLHQDRVDPHGGGPDAPDWLAEEPSGFEPGLLAQVDPGASEDPALPCWLLDAVALHERARPDEPGPQEN